jgi:hypothetical protein
VIVLNTCRPGVSARRSPIRLEGAGPNETAAPFIRRPIYAVSSARLPCADRGVFLAFSGHLRLPAMDSAVSTRRPPPPICWAPTIRPGRAVPGDGGQGPTFLIVRPRGHRLVFASFSRLTGYYAVCPTTSSCAGDGGAASVHPDRPGDLSHFRHRHVYVIIALASFLPLDLPDRRGEFAQAALRGVR